MPSIRCRDRNSALAGSAALIGLFLSGCAPDVAAGRASDLLAASRGSTAHYLIGSGDQVSVHFTYNPSFDQTVQVQPDGRIALPMVGTVQASGQTPDGLSGELASQYTAYLRRPNIVVTVNNAGSQRIVVGGEVGRAGSIPLEPGTTISDAITAAGGLKDSAAADRVLLLRRDGDGQSHAYTINVASIASGTDLSQDVVLQARDNVFVPRTGLAEMNLFMKHVFRDNLPINVGAGMGL